MLTIVFAVMMVAVFGKLIALSFRAAWGLTKCLLYLVCLPILILGVFAMGMIYLALPILIIVGIVTLLKSILS